MWRLQDARRHHRRVSAHEHLQTLHRHDLTRERLPHLRPSAPLRRPAGAPVRRLLISWLFAESSALALHPATPALAASYLDRLLPLPRAPLPRAQPLAAACLLLAAKLSEVGGDAIDVAYRLSVRVALPLELLALDLLRWDLVAPTPYTFLVFFARRVWLPAAARAAAAAHLNRALLYPHARACLPSSLALACVLLLEREALLPPPCKRLALVEVRRSAERVGEVSAALRCFLETCPDSTQDRPPSDRGGLVSDASTSSVASLATAYPHSGSSDDSMQWFVPA